MYSVTASVTILLMSDSARDVYNITTSTCRQCQAELICVHRIYRLLCRLSRKIIRLDSQMNVLSLLVLSSCCPRTMHRPSVKPAPIGSSSGNWTTWSTSARGTKRNRCANVRRRRGIPRVLPPLLSVSSPSWNSCSSCCCNHEQLHKQLHEPMSVAPP